MSISEIELICGQTPVGFKKEIITSSNHIFEVDPNFTRAINLAKNEQLKGYEHPKINKLVEILNNEESKVLIL